MKDFDKRFLKAESPYVEMFGSEGTPRGRPPAGSPAYMITAARPPLKAITASDLGLEYTEDSRRLAANLTAEARRRAQAVVVKLHDSELRDVFDKERAHILNREA